MKLFVECPYCNYVLYTKETSLLEEIAKRELCCPECNHRLDCMRVFLCSKLREDEFCNSCSLRFRCFTSLPAEVEDKALTK